MFIFAGSCPEYSSPDVRNVGETLYQHMANNGTCVHGYHSNHQETENFYYNWTRLEDVNPAVLNQTSSKDLEPFTYQSNTGNLGMAGYVGMYPGGGYVATLGRFRHKVEARLDELRGRRWVDRSTRALISDVITYNANTNLFTRIRVLMEQTPLGYMLIQSQTR